MDENLNVAANTEEVATPQETSVDTNTGVTAEPTKTVDTEPSKETDITQTQSFAKRLKEETERVRTLERDAMISEMYGESHGIHTYADYQAAVKKAQDEAEIQKNTEKYGDPELAKELLEAKRFREQYETEKLTRSQQEAKQKDYEAFLNAYPDVKADEIPITVWEDVEKGKSLVDAYAKHENTLLKAKLAEYEKGSKTLEVNSKNAENTTGSVTGNGTTKDQLYSREEVEKMSVDEVKKNYNRILESSKHWK